MTPLLLAAPTLQRGRDYLQWQGTRHDAVRVVVKPEQLQGQRGTYVLALDRKELDPQLERELSFLAQAGTTVINVHSDPLRTAPPDILAVALAERGQTAYRVRSAVKSQDYIVTVTKADTYALPEFETAEEALEFLEKVEHQKKMRDAHMRGVAADRAERGFG